MPTLRPGDIVLLRKRPANTGDVVVVDHVWFGIILKRIDPNGQLIGDGPASTPSDELGPYKPRRLIGVAILAVTPRGIRRLSPRRHGTRA